jgi:N-acetylglutamate synthase-like GNAT family acetyltransferase
MLWLQVFGWLGSALLVFSVLQTHVMRFRVANLTASLILTVYNAILSVWPMAAVNACLVVINLWFIITMTRSRSENKAFEFAMVGPDEPVVARFVERHRDDIAQFHPRFATRLTIPGAEAALIFHDDTVIGLVAYRRDEQDHQTAEILADFVISSYRDYSPGRFVYSSAGPLAEAGIRMVFSRDTEPKVTSYFQAVGFTTAPDGEMRCEIYAA